MTIKTPSRTQKENQALGQLTAVGMGAGVLSLHLAKGHELLPSSIAATKQYFYSAVIAVLLIETQPRVYERMLKTHPNSLLPDLAAITVPAAITTFCTFITHCLGEGTIAGTPEVLASTAITGALAPIGYTILHVRRILNEFDDLEFEL
jgi:hypothetical protein